MAYAEQEPSGRWRCRYQLPDKSLGSKSGFTSPTAAKAWGDEQEALMRRNLWIDPRDAETPFGEFAQEWLDARAPRLERGTAEKYRSVMVNHLLPQWEAWPLIGIFNGYIEIEKMGFRAPRGLRRHHGGDDLRVVLQRHERRCQSSVHPRQSMR
jgi:hypothetical protein